MKIKFVFLLFGLLIMASPLRADNDYSAIMQHLIESGDKAAEEYTPEQPLEFGNRFSQLYFGHFEGQGLEFAVGQADNDGMLKIEMSFSRLINSAMTAKSKATIAERWQELRALLVAAPMIESHSASFMELVVQSLLILVREGTEALLVVAALVAYLRKAGAADRIYLIWLGTLAALVASVLTAYAINSLIKNSGAARETLEGVTMLIAALLLSYVSAWLFARREIQQWQGFMQDKLGTAISKGSLLTIVSVAFFSVYREGAETILFYQALLNNADGKINAIMAGIGVGSLILLIIFALIFLLSVKLPLKLFFTATAVMLYGLSVIFAGKATLELQISGWLSNNHLSSIPTISWLGLFPSAECLIAQAVMLLLPICIWLLFKTNSQQKVAV